MCWIFGAIDAQLVGRIDVKYRHLDIFGFMVKYNSIQWCGSFYISDSLSFFSLSVRRLCGAVASANQWNFQLVGFLQFITQHWTNVVHQKKLSRTQLWIEGMNNRDQLENYRPTDRQIERIWTWSCAQTNQTDWDFQRANVKQHSNRLSKHWTLFYGGHPLEWCTENPGTDVKWWLLVFNEWTTLSLALALHSSLISSSLVLHQKLFNLIKLNFIRQPRKFWIKNCSTAISSYLCFARRFLPSLNITHNSSLKKKCNFFLQAKAYLKSETAQRSCPYRYTHVRKFKWEKNKLNKISVFQM